MKRSEIRCVSFSLSFLFLDVINYNSRTNDGRTNSKNRFASFGMSPLQSCLVLHCAGV